MNISSDGFGSEGIEDSDVVGLGRMPMHSWRVQLGRSLLEVEVAEHITIEVLLKHASQHHVI